MVQNGQPLLVTVKEASKLIGLSARMLYTHLRQGRVPARIVVKLGRRVYLSRPGLEDWLLGRITNEVAPETETRATR